ncbi:hypothetical protein, partial [Nodosilinea nodulosa]|uniref:hypothetical protein n=1 Tax=Nodosilinea nodulosa TaxID=416001 RepID=UPI001CEC22BA
HTGRGMSAQCRYNLAQAFCVAQVLEMTGIDVLAHPIVHGLADGYNGFYLPANGSPNARPVTLRHICA